MEDLALEATYKVDAGLSGQPVSVRQDLGRDRKAKRLKSSFSTRQPWAMKRRVCTTYSVRESSPDKNLT